MHLVFTISSYKQNDCKNCLTALNYSLAIKFGHTMKTTQSSYSRVTILDQNKKWLKLKRFINKSYNI